MAVVGAGLSGLVCSVELGRAGLDVQVVEAADAVGGRVRTDLVGGFRLDRGFQVLSTGYPQAQRTLNFDELELRRFSRAALLYVEGRHVRLADPRHGPVSLLRAATAPIGNLKDKIALATYAGLVAALPASVLRAQQDLPAHQAWRSRGLSKVTIDRVLRPFFAGVVLENDMNTSRRFVDLMMRMFVRGHSVVPAAGMQQVAEQLAARLPVGAVHLDTPARRVRDDGLDTDHGSIAAAAVVVATDPDSANDLLGGLPPPPWKGVTTIYHAAEVAPMSEPMLVIDTEPSPINNTVVVTAAAPSYALNGQALIATSLVHGAWEGDAGEPAVRERLATLYRTSTAAWDHVATYDIPRALPAMSAPHEFRKPVRHGKAYVCGDHRDTSSIQGAMVSGRRAASAVLADLAAGAR